MIFHPAGSRPSIKADPDYFTGDVWIDPIIIAPEPATLRTLRVRFSPGGRTNWHSHGMGQTLYVVEGQGWLQVRGEAAKPLKPGDSAFIPADVEHWHGATSDTGMTHIAMQEEPKGKGAVWLEPVAENHYAAAASAKQA